MTENPGGGMTDCFNCRAQFPALGAASVQLVGKS